MSKIFIQIASYRDPQLLPTIKDAIEQAKFPEKLVFGICRQYHPEDKFDDLSEYKNDERFKIIDVLYSKSNGVCWARNQIQQLYQDEEYTLQIDSHMRFEKYWDETLIKMLQHLQDKGFKKPLLTGYPPSFDPDNDPNGRQTEPCRILFKNFTDEGTVTLLPEFIPNYKDLVDPVPARFYAAGFCFTLGQFSKEVQHNPDYYFIGEEISITVRAYTHGYDLFHPHKVIIWHEYIRKHQSKHWGDHKEWYKKNNLSYKLNKQLLGIGGEQIVDFKEYGFGVERTLKDYEIYAGINFKEKIVQKYTLDKNYPPNPIYKTEKEWLESFYGYMFSYCININKHEFKEKDYDFWVVTFYNEKNDTIYRKEINKNDIKIITNNPTENYIICREFQTFDTPNYWVLWPHSLSKGWCNKIEGKI